jgi:hypothetical protein
LSTEPGQPESYAFRGDVLERQSFLNGTRSYTIAGEGTLGEQAWSFSLALTLPREAGEPLSEGDLALEIAGLSWDADVADGTYEEVADDASDAPVISVRCRFVRNPEVESSVDWPSAEAELRISVDMAELTLRPG